MKHEQSRSNLAVRGGSFTPMLYVVAERTRRKTQERDPHGRLSSTVDLAKQPGLLYRLHIILNC